MSGKDTKKNDKGLFLMTFRAFGLNDLDFQKPLKDGAEDLEYMVMINPESFERDFTVKYTANQTVNSSSTAGNFAGVEAERYSFSLVLDGTGLVNPERCDVKAELDKLIKVLLFRTDSGYRPNNVEIIYCKEIFHCRVTSLKIQHTLCKPDGSPLRLRVTCSFSSVNKKQEEKAPSPPKKTPKKKKRDVPSPSVQNTCSPCPPCPPCTCDNQSHAAAVSSAKEQQKDTLYCSEDNRI